MPVHIVVGLQWGDEGKAKALDVLSEDCDLVVRYAGGANAGHTVVVDGERFAFHLVPCGVVRPDVVSVVANGVAFEPQVFFKELDELDERGRAVGPERLRVSERAHLVMPYHRLLDGLAEREKGDAALGTTVRGIGPCYADKAARVGLRVGDLFRPEHFRTRVRARVEELNVLLAHRYGESALDAEAVAGEMLALAPRLEPYVTDTVAYLAEAVRAGRRILFEGAQAALLDIDLGTYPYVTSSNASACGAAAGAGVSPRAIGRILGVTKAYTTRVGAGPFPTEIEGAEGDAIRERGGEYGTTTGRPRRCGWFDAVAARYAARVNGIDAFVLTKLDVLGGCERVRIATAYRIGGRTIPHFPSHVEDLAAAEPVYEELDGWSEDITGARRVEDLPAAARRYLERVTGFLEVPCAMVSVGKDRAETVIPSTGKELAWS